MRNNIDFKKNGIDVFSAKVEAKYSLSSTFIGLVRHEWVRRRIFFQARQDSMEARAVVYKKYSRSPHRLTERPAAAACCNSQVERPCLFSRKEEVVDAGEKQKRTAGYMCSLSVGRSGLSPRAW